MAKHAKHSQSATRKNAKRETRSNAPARKERMPLDAPGRSSAGITAPRRPIRAVSDATAPNRPVRRSAEAPRSARPEGRTQAPAGASAPAMTPMQPATAGGKKPARRKGGCLVSLLLVFTILFILAGATLIVRPGFATPILEGVFGIKNEIPGGGDAPYPIIIEVDDVAMTEEAKQAEQKKQAHKRYLVAQCQGVDIYSPISQDELTGVIMHQASYEWGQVMTTQVTEADLPEYEESDKPLRVNNQQVEGEWVDADMAHLYRETDATEMDTSLDLGAAAGTTVYAPVTGEVIAVEEYDLYDETPDVRIHIRPDANPDLDVVLLHQEGPMVSVGDKVVAGETPISKVRDIAAHLTDIQLAFYTDTDGNHSHVQVNDLRNAEYVAKYNLPAL